MSPCLLPESRSQRHRFKLSTRQHCLPCRKQVQRVLAAVRAPERPALGSLASPPACGQFPAFPATWGAPAGPRRPVTPPMSPVRAGKGDYTGSFIRLCVRCSRTARCLGAWKDGSSWSSSESVASAETLRAGWAGEGGPGPSRRRWGPGSVNVRAGAPAGSSRKKGAPRPPWGSRPLLTSMSGQSVEAPEFEGRRPPPP